LSQPDPPDPKSASLPEEHPPDSVRGRSIDLSGPPGTPLPPPVDLARPATQRPQVPRSGKPFDPRIVVPMDLLDPHLPSSRALQTQLREARWRRWKLGLWLGAAVLGGGLLGATVIFVAPLFRAHHQPVEDLSVSFSVDSQPPGATILIDGKSTEKMTPTRLTDWDFSVPHRLALQLRDFYTEQREVPAGLHPPDLNLQLARLSHLTVRSEPTGASIFLGKEEIGVTPDVFELPAERDVEVAVRLAGYLPVSQRVRLNPAEEATRDVVLHALGRLEVNSEPQGAKVSLDRQKPVVVPVAFEVESGTPHRIEVTVPGLPVQAKTLTLKDGQRLDLTFTFEDPRDRAAKAELSRLKAQETSAQRKLDAIHRKGSSNEFFSTVNRLHNEDQLSDEIDRMETREQEISDELANHQLELEDRIKVANMGDRHE
jgi:hypothetical protein